MRIRTVWLLVEQRRGPYAGVGHTWLRHVPHIDRLLFDGSPYDAAVIGEGERPLLQMVQELLCDGRLSSDRYGPDNIEDLDELPPYAWHLLDHYWPKAKRLGGKLQVYLARGCPYHCTFCMERAKIVYKWRAFSADRAVDALERLSKKTDLGHWIVNVADPLFGFRRSWRRQVLEGIIDKQLFPKQYWTLTRSDDLDEPDVELLAKARFSIGIGAETGSPTMINIMQKAARPERYTAALERLAGLSKKHGLNWAADIIVGHPGETRQTMIETRDFLRRLVVQGKETCGWLSFDPFRVYPGALVHEEMARWEQQTGARFFHKAWWKSGYDAPFKANTLTPRVSSTSRAACASCTRPTRPSPPRFKSASWARAAPSIACSTGASPSSAACSATSRWSARWSAGAAPRQLSKRPPTNLCRWPGRARGRSCSRSPLA